jgi:hypothetical protein
MLLKVLLSKNYAENGRTYFAQTEDKGWSTSTRSIEELAHEFGTVKFKEHLKETGAVAIVFGDSLELDTGRAGLRAIIVGGQGGKIRFTADYSAKLTDEEKGELAVFLNSVG